MAYILRILWRYLQTYSGLISLWLMGAALAATLGINLGALKLPIEQAAAMALAALLLSSIIFRAAVRAWLAAAAILGIGAGYLALALAGMWAQSWRIVQSLGFFLWQILTDFRGLRDDPEALQLALIALQESLLAGHRALIVLAFRFENWWAGLGQGGVSDPLVLQLLWGAAIWLAISFMSWAIWKRYQAFGAILALGLLLALVHYFSGKGYGYLIAFLVFSILLQISARGLLRQNTWEKRGIDYAADLSLDLNIVMLPLTGLIIALAAIVPAIYSSEFTNALYNTLNINANEVNEAALSLGLEPISNPAQAVRLQGLPRRHLLGNNPELSRQLVMTIKTGELEPMSSEEAVRSSIPGHYWRSLTFHRYSSWGWFFSANPPVKVKAGDSLAAPQGPGRRVSQTVQRGPHASDLLHTSGLPLSSNRRVEASYRLTDDLAAVTLSGPLYTADSWLPAISPSRLRAAGREYPDEIKAAYLSLPASIPHRVRNLALDLTAAQPTPYDKAVAIETYLRSFPYTLNAPEPPAEKDVVDYFLFELQQGYCDYYASSMVVLARAAGIPARFVIGYATGAYNAERAEYRVTEAEAHSWAQIYFPGVGWVDFEATAGRPALDRESDLFASTTLPGEKPEPFPESSSPAGATTDSAWAVHPFWWALTLLIALWATYLFFKTRERRLRRLSLKVLSGEVYGRLIVLATRTNFTVTPGCTPYEFAAAFSTHLEKQLADAPFYHRRDAPSFFEGIRRLAEVFVQQHYAPPQQTTPRQSENLLKSWHRLRAQLWRAIIISKLASYYSKFRP